MQMRSWIHAKWYGGHAADDLPNNADGSSISNKSPIILRATFFVSRFFVSTDIFQVKYRKINFDGMLRIQGRKGEVFSLWLIKMTDHRNPDAECKIETR